MTSNMVTKLNKTYLEKLYPFMSHASKNPLHVPAVFKYHVARLNLPYTYPQGMANFIDDTLWGMSEEYWLPLSITCNMQQDDYEIVTSFGGPILSMRTSPLYVELEIEFFHIPGYHEWLDWTTVCEGDDFI